jgi:hypothetical protein
MLYVMSILGYGDSLITLSLLERVGNPRPDCTVVGSDVTMRVASVLRDAPRCPVISILPDVAAFYTFHKSGARAAIVDVLRVRRWADCIQPEDHVVMENADWRSRLLGLGRARALAHVPRESGAYTDRAVALGAYFTIPPFEPCARPVGTAKRLLFNPSARHRSRVVRPEIVASVIAQCDAASVEVCLVDPDGAFADWQGKVAEYLRAPALGRAAEALRSSDRYLGPDSFFVHLAYYYRVPFLAFFQSDNFYFAPPGMMALGNYLTFQDTNSSNVLSRKLTSFLAGT